MDKLKHLLEDYGFDNEDGLRFALDQYQKIICELSHGDLSKFTYDADYLIEHFTQKFKDTIQPFIEDGLPQNFRSIVFETNRGDVFAGYFDSEKHLFINSNKETCDEFYEDEVGGWFYT